MLSKEIIKKLMKKELGGNVCVVTMMLNDKISCNKCSVTCNKLGDFISNNACVIQRGFVVE